MARLGALGLIAIGIGALFAPRSAARGYGLPADSEDARALFRALGGRDLVLGLLLASSFDDPAVRSRALALIAVVGATDAAVVGRSRGFVPELGIHAVGTLALLLGALDRSA